MSGIQKLNTLGNICHVQAEDARSLLTCYGALVDYYIFLNLLVSYPSAFVQIWQIDLTFPKIKMHSFISWNSHIYFSLGILLFQARTVPYLSNFVIFSPLFRMNFILP